ncbi:MAG: dehydrogenase, selenocysteine-containing protein [Dehalococcoidia bacterium]|nr:dehydrogenase, selenocysteine-containing protein [Dehalococcoidia bacterium]
MALIPPADSQKLRDILAQQMVGNVYITLLNEPGGGLVLPGRPERAYGEVDELMTEMAELSPKLHVETINVREAPERLQEYGVGDAPVIVFERDGRRNVRFFGFPGGHEFSNLLQTIIAVSRGEAGLPEGFIQEVNALPGPLHLQVFVTPT